MTKKLFLFTILLQLSFQLCAQTDITVHDDNTGKDEVIELPEGMIYETDRLLNEWNAKNYLMNDINCESSSENPQYSKEEYISRLSRLPNIIEMPYNDVVRKLIDNRGQRLWATSWRSNFL